MTLFFHLSSSFQDLCPPQLRTSVHLTLFNLTTLFLTKTLPNDLLPFNSLLHLVLFLNLILCCFSILPISCIFLILVFCSLLFVVLWETVMGPKPARIKGNKLFYPFSCESKASAEVQHFIFCLSFIVLYCLSLSSLPTLSQF